jgi:cell division protein ZapA
MLVMAGLMVADRLSEAIRRIEALEEQVDGLREARNAAQAETKAVEDQFTGRLEAASKRLEMLAREMGK